MHFVKKIMILFIPLFIQMDVLYGQPSITGIVPNRGPVAGSTSVLIVGSGFTSATSVTFGGKPAQSFIIFDDNTIEARTPVSVPGAAEVVVTDSSGSSLPNIPFDLFVYLGVWTAYETNQDDNTVTPIDVNTNALGNTIPVNGNGPTGIAITPDGKTAYVANLSSDTVTPIDLSTNTPGTPISVGGQPIGVAITLDGKTVYVSNQLSNTVTPIDVATNTAGPGIAVGGLSPINLAVSPSNTKVFTTNVGSSDLTPILIPANTTEPLIMNQNGPAGIATLTFTNQILGFVANNLTNTVSVIDLVNNVALPTVIPVGMPPVGVAITSNNTKAYIATSSPNIIPINLVNNTPQAPILVGDFSITIAFTPDNQKAYATVGANFVIPITVATNTPQLPGLVVGNGPFGIAITPDQSPVAFWTSSADEANTLRITFDGSNSVSPVGTIATYAWDFGDGTTATTNNPIIVHTYATEGTFVVTLTVTNSAGTSTIQLFTGQTMSNNGGPLAILTQPIGVLSNVEDLFPPARVCGRQKKNIFATQTDIVNIITWKSPRQGAVPTSYRIYRDKALTRLIRIIPADSKLRFEDHNRKKGKTYTYFIVSVDALGRVSKPASVTVRPKENCGS